jgi:hypothetical protein
MRPLTPDDLLPLSEYAGRRREFFDSLTRYLDRYRRVRIGPRLMLVFENRQTLWFRVQELLRVSRLSDPARVSEELALYNRLLPGRGHLQAALLIDATNEAPPIEEGIAWERLRGDNLCMRLGEMRLPAYLVTCRPEDRAIGMAHWVRFQVGEESRRLLADLRQPALLMIDLPSYQHESSPFSEEMRQSLLEDLELSDRD